MRFLLCYFNKTILTFLNKSFSSICSGRSENCFFTSHNEDTKIIVNLESILLEVTEGQ